MSKAQAPIGHSGSEPAPEGANGAGGPIAATRQGLLAGRRDRGVIRFDGVRYAAPVSGAGRWSLPRPPAAWHGVRDAKAPGPSAPQDPTPYEWFGDVTAPFDEDCLFLNVATPALDGTRPVLVWVHGGAFCYGAGSEPVYDGVSLAQRGDVVVVTINYRLGAFGFMAADTLLAIDHPTANLGLRDVIAALQWVRDNIAGFGGDPDAVTLAGESAGGMIVATLMAVRQADGLYHRAIVQSGGDFTIGSTAQAADNARRIAQAAGTADLFSLPTQDLLRAQQSAIRSPFADFDGSNGPWPQIRATFQPTVEKGFLEEDGVAAVAGGRATRVPLLVGACADEWSLFSFRNPGVLDDATLRARLARMFPDVDAAIDLYRRDRSALGADAIFAAAMSDHLWRQPALRLAHVAADAGAPTFAFLFDWGPQGCWHGFDLPLVFGNFPASALTARCGGPPPTALTWAVQDSWIAFVRSGDPTTTTMQPWPMFDRAHRSIGVFDATPSVRSDPFGGRRRQWSSIYRELA